MKTVKSTPNFTPILLKYLLDDIVFFKKSICQEFFFLFQNAVLLIGITALLCRRVYFAQRGADFRVLWIVDSLPVERYFDLKDVLHFTKLYYVNRKITFKVRLITRFHQHDFLISKLQRIFSHLMVSLSVHQECFSKRIWLSLGEAG